jgi:hypothetical protein
LHIEWARKDDADEVGGEARSANLDYEEEDGAERIEVSGEGEC